MQHLVGFQQKWHLATSTYFSTSITLRSADVSASARKCAAPKM